MDQYEFPAADEKTVAQLRKDVKGVQAQATVSLDMEGESYVGMATGPASQSGRMRLVAQAALDAVEQVGTFVELEVVLDEGRNRQIRRLLVLDHDKKLVGIVSLGDLATGSDEPDIARETLQEVSEPNLPV